MAKTETKIIEIRIDLLKGLTDIAELQKKIETLTAANKDLLYVEKEITKENGKKKIVREKNINLSEKERETVAANSVALKDYRQQVNSLIKESANEIRTTVQKTGHIEKLKAEVSNLTLQYERLNKTELEGAKGTQVLTSLKGKREELAKLNAAYGNHQLNVGNYSSATKMLGINIGQVMKEMPNFAISARTGILSLTNNLPMLGEAIKAVRMEQIAAKKAQEGLTAAQIAAMPNMGKIPSMFSLITKSVFGLTGILSIGMVLLQLYGKEIIEWVGGVFRAITNTDDWRKAVERLNREFDNSKIIMNEALDIQKLYIKERSKQLALEIKMNQDRWDELEGRELTGLRRHRASGIKFNKKRLEELEEMELEHNKHMYKLKSEYRVALVADEKQSEEDIKKLVQTRQEAIEQEYQEDLQKLEDGLAKKYITEEQAFEARKRLKEKFDKDIAALSGKAQNYKDTQEWKDFSARYDAMREQMKMEEDLQKHQYMVLRQLQESFSETKAEKERKEQERQQKIILNATKKTQAALARVLEDETRQSFSDVDAQIENYMRKISAKVADADTILATAQLKGQATTQLQMNLLDKQERLERLAATKRGESITAIEEYYAAKRAEIKRLEVESSFSSVASLFGSIAGLLEENSKGQKMAASAQALINTYLGATSAYAQTPGGVLVKSLAAAAAIAAGLVNIKKIWAVKTDVPDIKPEMSKKTVTEKFHSGGTIGETTGIEKPITALTGESVNSIATTQMFSPLLSALNQLGGGKAITSGVANTGMGTDMLASAFSKALRNMPAPILIMEDFEKASDKHKKIQNNRIIK